MMRCIIIDDEPLALQQLATYVSQVPFLQLVAECQSALDAQEIVKSQEVDLMFVDISMPDLNGMDFVKSLITKPLVVFTTAYSDYALDAYKVDAVDYLLKPFSLEEFKCAAMKAKRRYEAENRIMPSAVHDGSIFLKADYKVVRVDISDISYVEGLSEYLKIYIDGRKPLIVLMAMKKLAERLSPDFMRIHKSYIINLRKIKEMTKSRITLDNGTVLPIGDSYKERFMAYMNERYIGK